MAPPCPSDPTPDMASAADLCPFPCPQHTATFTWKPRSTGHWPELSVSVWPPHVGSASNNVTLAPLLQPASSTHPVSHCYGCYANNCPAHKQQQASTHRRNQQVPTNTTHTRTPFKPSPVQQPGGAQAGNAAANDRNLLAHALPRHDCCCCCSNSCCCNPCIRRVTPGRSQPHNHAATAMKQHKLQLAPLCHPKP